MNRNINYEALNHMKFEILLLIIIELLVLSVKYKLERGSWIQL